MSTPGLITSDSLLSYSIRCSFRCFATYDLVDGPSLLLSTSICQVMRRRLHRRCFPTQRTPHEHYHVVHTSSASTSGSALCTYDFFFTSVQVHGIFGQGGIKFYVARKLCSSLMILSTSFNVFLCVCHRSVISWQCCAQSSGLAYGTC